MMQNQRLSNLDAWKEYQAQVIGQTTKTLETITGPMLEEVVIAAVAHAHAEHLLRHGRGKGQPDPQA